MAPTEHGGDFSKKTSKQEEPNRTKPKETKPKETKTKPNKPKKFSSSGSLFSMFKKPKFDNNPLNHSSSDELSETNSANYELLSDKPSEKMQPSENNQSEMSLINDYGSTNPSDKITDTPADKNYEKPMGTIQTLLNTQDKSALGTGVKFDQNKLRYDLIPVRPMAQIAEVFTMGARKYKDRNWEKGMQWSRPIAALERHFQAFKGGEDHDPESGLLHLAHVAVNAMFLMEFYNIFPQGDDRVLPYKKHPRIGLDIDEVLADFIGHYSTRYELPIAESWNFDPLIKKRIVDLADDKEFWLSMPVKTAMKDIPFEPVCYITSRKCPLEWTKEWLHKNGFANVPVYSSPGDSKAAIAKENRLDWFIDDRYSNFIDLNENGICCFLFDAPHNKRYNVGYKRIFSLKGLPLF